MQTRIRERRAWPGSVSKAEQNLNQTGICNYEKPAYPIPQLLALTYVGRLFAEFCTFGFDAVVEGGMMVVPIVENHRILSSGPEAFRWAGVDREKSHQREDHEFRHDSSEFLVQ